MLTLALRTSEKKSHLYLYDNETKIEVFSWDAYRTLSETILTNITELLDRNKKKLADLEGIICFGGPGSFTGLRIGLTVANAIANSLAIPIVKTKNDDWLRQGITRLSDSEDDIIVIPDYGAEPHITKPIR